MHQKSKVRKKNLKNHLTLSVISKALQRTSVCVGVLHVLLKSQVTAINIFLRKVDRGQLAQTF